MNTEINNKDCELICSTLVSGSYSLDIYSRFNKIDTKKIEMGGTLEKPSSIIFLNQQDFLVFSDEYDYIIDFSNNVSLPETFQKTEFYLLFNRDGSIQCMFEIDAKNVSKSSLNHARKFSVYHKSHLFFQKQIRHLPCDNYLISFGESELKRMVLISLFLKNQHIIDLKIAYNHETLYEIYKQKYFMSKLSFYDFESIDIPHEYFCKNQRIVINSVIHKSSPKLNLFNAFSRYLTEITDKTIVFESIRTSKFYADMLIRIGTIQDKLVKEMLFASLNTIPMHEKYYFGLSFEKLEQQSGEKLACSDLTEANFFAPMLSDFFFQCIEDVKFNTFSSLSQLQKHVDDQVELFGLSSLVNKYKIDIQTYFSLFLLYFTAKKPNLINVRFLKHIQHLQAQMTIAS